MGKDIIVRDRDIGWQQMVQIAQEHALALAQRQQEEHRKQEAESPAKEQAQLEQSLEMIDKINARAALTAFRDHNWKEGEITAGKFGHLMGLRLTSEPYPTLCLGTNTNGVFASTGKDVLSVSVAVDPDRQPDVAVVSLNRELNIAWAQERNLPLTKAIKKSGLYNGLYYASYLMHSYPNLHHILIDPKGDNTAGERGLYRALVVIAQIQQHYKYLPHQVRDFYQGLIDQLPDTLQEKGSVGGYELRHWARELTGNKLGLFLDRHLSPNRNPLDRWEHHQALRH